MKFADIPGQENIKNQLTKSIKNNMLSHAIILSGQEGYGGLPLALATASYLNCENPSENDSCGVCPSCNKSEKLIHPDIHFTFPTITDDNSKTISCKSKIAEWREMIFENPYFSNLDWLNRIKAENKQGKIFMEECHQIIKNVSLTAFENKAKVQIIWSAEDMGNNANSLLKLIEEPSQHTFFIFLCKDINKMLGTIVSRSRLIQLSAFSHEDIIEKLSATENISKENLMEIAGLSSGNMHEAYRLINSGNVNYFEKMTNWLRACYMNDLIKVLDFSNELSDLGREKSKDFIKYTLRLIRESFLKSSNLDQLNRISVNEKDFVDKFSKLVNRNNIHPISEKLSNTIYYIERNANIKVVVFNLSLQLGLLLHKS